MDFGGDLSVFGVILQVALIDLLLSGDNAVVIALACRSLPPHLLRKAMLVGTGAAVLMRVFLTTLVGVLLLLPGLKLVGSVALLVIAVKLVIDEDDDQEESTPASETSDFMGAVILILLADLVMSLDNVVALSAVAQGNLGVLVFGLLLSVPLLMFGSRLIGLLLERYPELITAGGALLGWVAGQIGVTDPLVVDWVNSQAPALALIVPALGAAFVLLQSRIIQAERPKDKAAPKPKPQPKPQSLAVIPAAPAPAAPPIKWGELLTSLLPKRRSDQPEPLAVHHHLPPSIIDATAAGVLILVAEDNAADRAEAIRSLNWLGYAAEGVETGEEAWELLQAKRHALVLTDCYMPDLDGFGLCLRLRGSDDPTLSALPVVAMVAHYDPADGIGYRQAQAGMNACVGKPAALAQLEQAVTDWLPAAAALRRPILGENP